MWQCTFSEVFRLVQSSTFMTPSVWLNPFHNLFNTHRPEPRIIMKKQFCIVTFQTVWTYSTFWDSFWLKSSLSNCFFQSILFRSWCWEHNCRCKFTATLKLIGKFISSRVCKHHSGILLLPVVKVQAMFDKSIPISACTNCLGWPYMYLSCSVFKAKVQGCEWCKYASAHRHVFSSTPPHPLKSIQ